mgnify:CR=1 FL=1
MNKNCIILKVTIILVSTLSFGQKITGEKLANALNSNLSPQIELILNNNKGHFNN